MSENPRTARIGSLCMGYGGLDLALEQVLGARTVWCSEFDKAPSKIIAERFPGVPNYGDLKLIEWADVPPVDILTAGYPCQPFSHAGKRKGIDDPRHLWPYIADAIRVLRPRLVVLENVAGHLGLGFDTVLADLAEIRFDAEWVLVRASDVGACHQRTRLFVVATDATCGPGEARLTRGDATVPAADAGRERHGRRQDARGLGRVDGEDAGEALERERSRSLAVHRGAAAPADTSSEPEREPADEAHAIAAGRQARAVPGRRDRRAWGDYAAAVERHEHALGRGAPSPVDDDGRLDPRFVEWMMMLPEGWVTDVLTTRTHALKALGNGVVPPQAAHALRHLLARSERELTDAA